MSTNESSIERILGLDFETANPSRTSVCSLGLCLVNFSSGEVIDKKQFLSILMILFIPETFKLTALYRIW